MILKQLKVQNYRTLENISIDFLQEYNAICGRNNSGKSNIVRAIRLLFGEENDRFPFVEGIDFSYKSDLCAWKKGGDKKEIISIEGKIELCRDSDEGIIRFIESIEQEKTKLEKDAKTVNLEVKIEASADSPKFSLSSLQIDDHIVDDSVIADSIYEKIKKSVVFHNSTMTSMMFFSRRRRMHGVFSSIPETNKKKIDDKSDALKKEVNKVFKEHANELQLMLGRLGTKLEVKLDTPEFDFEEYPYGISLGYKDFNVPLDDWGSGTRNQTLIIKSIFDAKNTKIASSVSERITPIVLIEEPESFLHPLAQAQFSDVLQSLSKEWGIQVIASTHSPYLLSHLQPEANILLDRKKAGRSNNLLDTFRVPFEQDNWKKPFEHTLGICGPEFDIFKDALFSQSNKLLLVEGDTDKEYFEMLKDTAHGKNALDTECQIFAYDGKDNIRSDILIKFIRDRFSVVIITSDLDAEETLCHKLETLGFKKNEKYFPIGQDQAGKRDIEGLLPDEIRIKVRAENNDLVDASHSDKKEEVKSAKNNLKKKYLKKFKAEATIEKGYFDEFYKITKKINKALLSK